MEAGSSSRMQAALRVVWAHCKLGETVTPEDVENVRWWAGDKTLSPPEAATVIELEERRGEVLSPVEAATSLRMVPARRRECWK